MSPPEALEFLRLYRQAYGELAAELRSRRALPVLEIDTGTRSASETLAIARTALDTGRTNASPNR